MATLEVNDLRSLPHPRPPSTVKTHRNGVKLAEAINRDDSPFLATTGNIAAIDFGTANCSIAYSTAEDEEMTPLNLPSHEGLVRIPTIILVNEDGRPIKFGAGAIRHYQQRIDPSKRMKYHLFERIKLALGPNKDISRETTLPDINGNMFFLRDVIALFIKHLKDELQSCFQTLCTDLKATDFHWVITVPAIWSASGKQMMREAAYQAGLCGTHTIEKIAVVDPHSSLQSLEIRCPERLSLALEPEAASFYCRTMADKDIVDYITPPNVIPKTHKYIVVDIGGGTADISAHGQTSEGKIEILTAPEGNLFGGNAVNHEFQYFLGQLVDDPGFSTYLSTGDIATDVQNKVCVRNIVYDEFEQEKKEFGKRYISQYVNRNPDELDSSERVFNIKLSESFYEFYKQHLRDGISRLHLDKNDKRVTLGRGRLLCIHYSKMEEFFDGPVSKTLANLKNIFMQVDNDLSTLFLVGGFGGCQYMYYRMQQALQTFYGPNRFRIVIPKKPHLAVVQGALQYRKIPELIKSRVIEATYGTETMLIFNENIHDVQYRYSTKSGEQLCQHLFSPLAIEGERINYNQVKRNKYRPVEALQKSVRFNLLTSEDKDLFYSRSPNEVLKEGVKVLGTITVSSPNVVLGIDRDIYLTFDFRHTEIQVHAYDASSGNECRAVLDCLTQID